MKWPGPCSAAPLLKSQDSVADRVYTDAIRWLARRELSEAQVRQRLFRLGHSSETVNRVIDRLKDERAIDDTRAAAGMARAEFTMKKRGPRRVRQKLESAGIEPEAARQAVDRALEGIDEDDLVEAALARRLKSGAFIATDSDFDRLGRFLRAQGFEDDRILRVLSARRSKMVG